MKVDDATWDRVAPLLRPALDAGGNTHTLEDVRALIEAGGAELWVGRASAAVTEFHYCPRSTALHVWLGGGDMREIMAGDEGLLRFARTFGADRITVDGRLGWKRALAPLGYTVQSVTLARYV